MPWNSDDISFTKNTRACRAPGVGERNKGICMMHLDVLNIYPLPYSKVPHPTSYLNQDYPMNIHSPP